MKIIPMVNNKINNQPSFGRVLYCGEVPVKTLVESQYGKSALEALSKLEKAHGGNDVFSAVIGIEQGSNSIYCEIITDKAWMLVKSFPRKAATETGLLNLFNGACGVLDKLTAKYNKAVAMVSRKRQLSGCEKTCLSIELLHRLPRKANIPEWEDVVSSAVPHNLSAVA